MNYVQHVPKAWNDILPETSPDATDLVSKLIQYSGARRLTASQALDHAFFYP
jgi:hypothetical protein